MSTQHSPTAQWFALQLRSNQEKIVQEALKTKGYGDFLPLYRKRTRWSDRVKEIDVPLFPGYIFSKFDVRHRLPILTIPGVVSIIGIGRNPEPVDEAELDAIRRFVGSGLPIMPWPFLQIGDRVLIESGVLSGLEGILVQTKSHCRVVVSVGLLQRSVSVEIDRSAVRPVVARTL